MNQSLIFRVLFIIFIMNMHSIHSSKAQTYTERKDVLHNIQLGYGGVFNNGYHHLIEIGYYRARDIVWASAGPSVALATMVDPQGNWHFGPQVGYEANLIFFDAKVDVRYLNQSFYVHPGIGLSLLGSLGLHVGYNACLNKKHASGISLGMYINLGKWSFM